MMTGLSIAPPTISVNPRSDTNSFEFRATVFEHGMQGTVNPVVSNHMRLTRVQGNQVIHTWKSWDGHRLETLLSLIEHPRHAHPKIIENSR